MLLLLLANLGFGAWTHGWLDDLVGVRARGDREPERLMRQLHPEAVVVVPSVGTRPLPLSTAAISAASAETDPPLAPPTCLEAGPFDALQVVAAEATLRSLEPPVAATSWTDQKTERPGAWMVYMGRYGSSSFIKKQDELKRRNVEYEEVHSPGLDPGLSLGRFDEKAAAEDALAAFSRQGIHTARVVRTGEPTAAHLLRFERPDAALAARLVGLSASQAALGKGFVACAVAASR